MTKFNDAKWSGESFLRCCRKKVNFVAIVKYLNGQEKELRCLLRTVVSKTKTALYIFQSIVSVLRYETHTDFAIRICITWQVAICENLLKAHHSSLQMKSVVLSTSFKPIAHYF